MSSGVSAYTTVGVQPPSLQASLFADMGICAALAQCQLLPRQRPVLSGRVCGHLRGQLSLLCVRALLATSPLPRRLHPGTRARVRTLMCQGPSRQFHYPVPSLNVWYSAI